MVKRTAWLFSFCLQVAWQLLVPSPASAQETGGLAPAGPAVPIADPEEARRETILAVLEKPEVRNAALAAGVDLEGVAAHIERLDGEPLARAARQAEELDRRLAINGTISSTTLIILLLITIFLIVVLSN